MPDKKDGSHKKKESNLKVGRNKYSDVGDVDDKTIQWQERLLPVMSSILIGMTIFFFLMTFIQMSYLHWNIVREPELDISKVEIIRSEDTFDNRMDARILEVQGELEAYIVSRRYHLASVLLMSGLWIRYLGFITGMIIALIGASFVLGKLREPPQEVGGEFSMVKFSIYTASPGIILVVLGTILMFTTIVDEDNYSVKDFPNYIYPSVLTTDLDDSMLDFELPEPIDSVDIVTPEP